jgi:predicted ABC-type ATPase
MASQTPRVRLFAGPNGSGKSTIKEKLSPKLIGIFINPDEIEKQINKEHTINFNTYQINISKYEITEHLSHSSVLCKDGKNLQLDDLDIEDNTISFTKTAINSYYASAIADMLRNHLLKSGISFSFESVMSHEDKVQFLKKAQESGYRTYLYYVATDDPMINIDRVEKRVKAGGHPVPKQKIIDRYYRSISLLKEAIQFTNRAYIFDNSGEQSLWMVEITNGTEWEDKSDFIHPWFVETYNYFKPKDIK